MENNHVQKFIIVEIPNKIATTWEQLITMNLNP